MRPLQFPLKSCGFSSAETGKEAIFALENGIFRRGVLRAHAPLNSAWSSHTFAPPCANACAVFRPCGLRFAPCPRGSSRFAASDARKLTCGTPCFIGLTTACFAHCARPSCVPAVHAAGDDFNAKGFRLSRALLEFLTVCGTVKEQPKFLHSRKMPSGLQAEFPLPPL